MTVTTRTLFV